MYLTLERSYLFSCISLALFIKSSFVKVLFLTCASVADIEKKVERLKNDLQEITLKIKAVNDKIKAEKEANK